MAQTEVFKISRDFDHKRLDLYLIEKFSDKTRSFFSKLIKSGNIRINGHTVKSGYIIQKGDEVEITLPDESLNLAPSNIPIKIVYEDDHIMVINKEAGMVVHPGKGTEEDTLVNALLYHSRNLSNTNSEERPGIVHRLDKNTSGLLVVAKTNQAHLHLQNQFDTGTIHRTYWALVWGYKDTEHETIETCINRSKKDPTKMSVAKTGRNAITHIKTLQTFEYISLLEVKLDTGRTHQIRVHLSFIHHPVVGDPEYNGRESQLKRLPHNLRKRGAHLLKILNRQALHAKKLTFIHPHSNKQVEFESDLPSDFAETLDKLPSLFLLKN
jgi:23S rRNA pseudouridine1911/1915/1917 synthase